MRARIESIARTVEMDPEGREHSHGDTRLATVEIANLWLIAHLAAYARPPPS